MAKKLQSLTNIVSLKNKTTLITGAAQGIGAAIANRYGEAGADLLLLDIDEARLEQTAANLKQRFDVKVETHAVNLIDSQTIDSFWESLPKTPDILINNAGIYVPMEFHKTDQAFIDRTMQLNLNSVMQLCRLFINSRMNEGGTIINIGSIEALTALKADMSIYAVSKAAVLTLTRSLAREYTKKGFKINALVPGGISTPGTTALGIQALKHLNFGIIGDAIRFNSRLPIARFGEPDEIAKMALVLGTPLSSYLAGSAIVVDGGFMTT